jgi:hypothetical protein
MFIENKVPEWHEYSKKGESSYKTMNGKALLQLPKEKNRRCHSKLFGRRSNFERSDVRKNYRD